MKQALITRKTGKQQSGPRLLRTRRILEPLHIHHFEGARRGAAGRQPGTPDGRDCRPNASRQRQTPRRPHFRGRSSQLRLAAGLRHQATLSSLRRGR
jgi:hypothetical protein